MNSNRKSFYTVAAFALALSSFAARAQQPDLQSQVDAAVSQPLQGVVVTGGDNPLFRADQRLALLNDSLPLDARGGAARTTDLERAVSLFPQDPEDASGEARRMMERGQTPPTGTDPDGEITLGTR